jgi:hypothetical protein
MDDRGIDEKKHPEELPFVKAFVAGVVGASATKPSAAATGESVLTSSASMPLAEPEPMVDPALWRQLLNPDLPAANWDVSGLFVYDKLFLRLLDSFRFFSKTLLFQTVHGAPFCRWNSGRSMIGIEHPVSVLEKIVVEYVRRGLTVEMTFSNCLLKEEHLHDELGNNLLKILDHHNEGENGVIVSQEILAGHVRKTHPRLKLVASVVKVSMENGRGNLDYYRRLEDSYDRIMLHPDDNFNMKLLEKIENKDKYAILVNEPCIVNCPVRQRHYKLVSEAALDSSGNISNQEVGLFKENRCQCLEDLLFNPERRMLALTNHEIKRIYELGFRNFKVQGRGMRSDGAMLMELSRVLFNQTPEASNRTTRFLQRLLAGGAER